VLPIPATRASTLLSLILLLVILTALVALLMRGLAPQAALTAVGGGALLTIELRNRLFR
jgi:hypothetical protein